MIEIKTHFHGDTCPGGHYRRNGRTGERERCVHEMWQCNHCHDDPPASPCPICGRVNPEDLPDPEEKP